MEERWGRVRQIVREECERIRDEILDVLEKNAKKTPIKFAAGQWTGITPEQLSAWKIAYGSVDVELEIKKSAAWAVSNPEKAPKSAYARFINAWLLREQNRSAIRSIPTRNEPAPRQTCRYCARPSTGTVNNIPHCSQHLTDAMDQRAA